MKKALGPSAQKTAPLKSSAGETIADRSKQLDRWAEHYQDLYLREHGYRGCPQQHPQPASYGGAQRTTNRGRAEQSH